MALSTRLCLEPDRGVTLLLKKAETGEVRSSRSRDPAALAERVASGGGAARRASGVARVGAWCWEPAVRAATLGVRGILFAGRATVGCRGPPAEGRSYGGMLAVASGCDRGSGPDFTTRDADVAFWSRDRRGWRDACGVVAVAAAAAAAPPAVTAVGGQAAVVMMWVVLLLLPTPLVLVVKIPADGRFLRVGGGLRAELAAAAAWGSETQRFGTVVWRAVTAGGGMAVEVGNWGIWTRDPGQTLIVFWAALTGRPAQATQQKTTREINYGMLHDWPTWVMLKLEDGCWAVCGRRSKQMSTRKQRNNNSERTDTCCRGRSGSSRAQPRR